MASTPGHWRLNPKSRVLQGCFLSMASSGLGRWPPTVAFACMSASAPPTQLTCAQSSCWGDYQPHGIKADGSPNSFGAFLVAHSVPKLSTCVVPFRTSPIARAGEEAWEAGVMGPMESSAEAVTPIPSCHSPLFLGAELCRTLQLVIRAGCVNYHGL